MVELKATGTQTVKPGGVVLFNDVTSINNSSIIHREGSGVVTIRNGSCGCSNFIKAVPVTFTSNVAFPTTPPTGETAATAPLSLAFAVGGEPDTSTEMIVTPASADEFFNVSRTTLIGVPTGCCTSVAVENTSNGTIVVENASLVIED